ncbi:hypothetical protein Hanom_Chr08g00758621 [Helianthus anomalus]
MKQVNLVGSDRSGWAALTYTNFLSTFKTLNIPCTNHDYKMIWYLTQLRK